MLAGAAESHTKSGRPGALLWLLAALPWAVLGGKPARAQLVGQEFQANRHTPNHQNYPAVAADAAGNFVVVWESDLQDGSGEGIFGQRFNSAGARLGGELQVNTFTTNHQSDPSVAVDGSGSFVVVWSGNHGQGYDILGQRFDPAGNRLGSEFLVNTHTWGSQIHPAIAADGTGGFVVVWDSYQLFVTDEEVLGQRFDAAGAKIGTEFQVNTHTTGSQLRPELAADSSGNFVVVWASSYQDGSDFGVFGQRFNSAGGSVGREFRVNSYTTDSQFFPAVAATDGGDFAVVWQSMDQDGSSWGVFGQAFDSAGTAVGSEVQVSTNPVGQQKHPQVAAGSAGGFLVTWQSYGVFAQWIDPAGNRAGSESRVHTHPTAYHKLPAVAANDADTFVVVWANSQDGAGFGVFGQRIAAPLFAHGFEAHSPFWSATTATMCAGHCVPDGTPDGICFCDDLCFDLGDCCLDACTTCGTCF